MANNTKYGYLISPAPQFLDTNGKPISGGKLKVYIAGTTTKATTYSDWNLTKNTWPIVLDSMGTCQVIVSSANLYKFVLESAEGEEPLVTRDNVSVSSEQQIIYTTANKVDSSDSTVDVTATTDPDTGIVTYDLSIQKEIDRAGEAEGALAEDIADEIDRAKTAEKAAKTEIVEGDNITVTKTVGADGQDVYTIDGKGEDNLVDDVRVNGTSVVTDKVANIDVPDAGTASPHMDGTASAGASGKFAREDHVHPSDTSREAVANKTTVVLGTSDSKYPTDKAVANFVNSSIATKKDKQTAVTFTGSTLKTPTSMTQDANGELAVTFTDIQSASTSQKGVVQLSDSTTSASSETAATSAAVKRAYNLAASKLDKDGLGDDVRVQFTQSPTRTNIATGSKLSTLFGQIRKWLADLKALAFKDKVGASDVESGTYPIDISGNAATLATPRKIDGVEFDGSGDIVHYGVCSTAYNVQAKVITCPGFVLSIGARIIIKFTENNNFREPTFNVNDTGAVPVRYFGSLLPSANFLKPGAVYQFVYDGTNYCFVGNFDNNNYAYQTALSTNAEYPVLCKNNANQTAENNFVRYASGITMNPSTNKITASGGFAGDLEGNAATASEAASGSTLENKINSKQDDLGISSSGSSTKFLNEKGEWATVTTPDVSGKADKVSGATAGDVATLDANGNLVDSGKTLGTSVPADASFTDDKVAQMKADSSDTAYPLLMAGTTDPRGNATVTRYDSGVTLDPSTNTIAANISGNATTATTASATSSGTISGGDDLNSYNTANRNYLCNANNASSVSNKPSGASGAFDLEVIRGTGSTCVQVYYSRDDVNFNYIRKCTGLNDGTWTGWVKLIDSDDTVASATTADKLGSANVGLPYMPIYLSAGTPMSIEDYFCRPLEDPSTRNLSADTTLNAVGGGKYVYNVSTSNTFNLTLASTASGPIAFVVRLKCTANCPYVNVTYNDAVEKTTLTRKVYLSSGKMADMCFTYYYGYFHLVSLTEGYYS